MPGPFHAMTTFADTFLLIYAALFPIVNPIGSAPLFLGLTHTCTEGQRNTLAYRVGINSFFLLLGSVLVGSHLLGFFGISLPVVRIGGGLVVTAFAWKLLNSETLDSDRADPAQAPRVDAFYPLTMPLTVGPGSISVAITLGSQRPKEIAPEHLMLLGSATLAGIAAMAATIYLCYRFGEELVNFLGKSGTNVVVRLAAFILLCIGIQILWSGWSELSALPH